jgi:hypothetical protein
MGAQLMSVEDPVVEVRPSPIQGVGIFATRDFRAGECIRKRNIVRDVTPDAPFDEALGESERHGDWLGGDRTVLLGFPDRHLNHRCDPNAYIREIEGETYIYARRDIRAGGEITNDYCMNSRGDETWQCNCGAADCRKIIHSDFFHLPLEKQVEYLPLLMDWFVEENSVEIEKLRGILQASACRRT